MAVGVALGRAFPDAVDALRRLEFGVDARINAPIAVFIWLMIVPMMMKIDFSSLAGVARRPMGLIITLFVNWLVKPFGMFFLGWFFFQILFLPLIGDELARQYTAGVVILAAAPCTAMVFVWSYLTDGDPAYTLVQVAVNDLVMLVLFAPIVGLLVGVSGLAVPYHVLLTAVAVFIVVPWSVGVVVRAALVRACGRGWFEASFLPRFQPVAVAALLATLVLIFAFQADNILG
ncbi:MAG: arsenic resistance protein, partial [Planctomycetia bacterium]